MSQSDWKQGNASVGDARKASSERNCSRKGIIKPDCNCCELVLWGTPLQQLIWQTTQLGAALYALKAGKNAWKSTDEV